MRIKTNSRWWQQQYRSPVKKIGYKLVSSFFNLISVACILIWRRFSKLYPEKFSCNKRPQIIAKKCKFANKLPAFTDFISYDAKICQLRQVGLLDSGSWTIPLITNLLHVVRQWLPFPWSYLQHQPHLWSWETEMSNYRCSWTWSTKWILLVHSKNIFWLHFIYDSDGQTFHTRGHKLIFFTKPRAKWVLKEDCPSHERTLLLAVHNQKEEILVEPEPEEGSAVSPGGELGQKGGPLTNLTEYLCYGIWRHQN